MPPRPLCLVPPSCPPPSMSPPRSNRTLPRASPRARLPSPLSCARRLCTTCTTATSSRRSPRSLRIRPASRCSPPIPSCPHKSTRRCPRYHPSRSPPISAMVRQASTRHRLPPTGRCPTAPRTGRPRTLAPSAPLTAPASPPLTPLPAWPLAYPRCPRPLRAPSPCPPPPSTSAAAMPSNAVASRCRTRPLCRCRTRPLWARR